MAGGILQTYLILMAIVTTSQPSGRNVVSLEDDKEIVQRMKEHKVTLGQHQLHLEKEIAELEGREESQARPLREVERKMEWHTCTVFVLLVPAVLVIWRQRRNGARGEHRAEETELGFLGKVCKGFAFLTKPLVLLRAICIFMGTPVGCLPFFAEGLAESPLKLRRAHKKNLVLEIR